MINFYGVAMIICSCGFVFNVVVLIVQYTQIRKLLRRRDNLLDELGMSKEELHMKPMVVPVEEKKTDDGDERSEKTKNRDLERKVRFQGVSSVATESQRHESGREASDEEGEEAEEVAGDDEIGTSFSGDINAFTTFLEEYQTALDIPIQVSALHTYVPGTLLTQFPFPPTNSSTITEVLKRLIVDVLRYTTHWQHPRYFGPNGPGRSVPDVAAFFFSPFLSPTVIGLEKKVMKSLKKTLDIPKEFAKEVMVESATEALFHVLMTARDRMLTQIFEKADAPAKMVVYCNATANIAVSKACRLTMMRLRRIPVMDAINLEAAIQTDISNGLLPVCIISTFTSYNYSTPEEKPELLQLATKYDVWLHVDASTVGGFWLHPAARRARPPLLQAESVYLEMFYLSEGMKLIWIKKAQSWREPLTQHSPKAVQIFSAFALLGLDEMKRRMEFFSGLAAEFRQQMSKFPMIVTSSENNFNTFCFQYKPSSEDLPQKNYYTKRLYAFLQQTHRFHFGYTTVGQQKEPVIVATVMGGAMDKADLEEMAKELRAVLEEFELKKDNPSLFSSIHMTSPPAGPLFPFIPMSSLHYDV